MSVFCMDFEEGGLTEKEISALEEAFSAFITADAPVAAEYLFVDEEEIRTLNRDMRSVDKVTDVLSFPTLDGVRKKALLKAEHPYDLDEEGRLFIGSIVVCVKRAQEQAEEYGHSFARELHYLVVHGTLHCLGYDHETDEDKKQMREEEEKILGRLGIGREKE